MNGAHVMDASSPAGLYVHVPFCLTRCGYCDFNTYEGLDHLSGRYVSALVREAELAGPDWQGVPFVSLFLGGGTPTTLPVETLGGLIEALAARFGIDADAEITVEANPDTVDEPYLRALRSTGVSRLSLGVQSFDRGRPGIPRAAPLGRVGANGVRRRAPGGVRQRQHRPHLRGERRDAWFVVQDRSRSRSPSRPTTSRPTP